MGTVPSVPLNQIADPNTFMIKTVRTRGTSTITIIGKSRSDQIIRYRKLRRI